MVTIMAALGGSNPPPTARVTNSLKGVKRGSPIRTSSIVIFFLGGEEEGEGWFKKGEESYNAK